MACSKVNFTLLLLTSSLSTVCPNKRHILLYHHNVKATLRSFTPVFVNLWVVTQTCFLILSGSLNISRTCLLLHARDRIVSIVTCYRLDCLGFEPRWRRGFPDTSRPARTPIQHPVQWVPGLFPRGKVTSAWR